MEEEQGGEEVEEEQGGGEVGAPGPNHAGAAHLAVTELGAHGPICRGALQVNRQNCWFGNILGEHYLHIYFPPKH